MKKALVAKPSPRHMGLGAPASHHLPPSSTLGIVGGGAGLIGTLAFRSEVRPLILGAVAAASSVALPYLLLGVGVERTLPLGFGIAVGAALTTVLEALGLLKKLPAEAPPPAEAPLPSR